MKKKLLPAVFLLLMMGVSAMANADDNNTVYGDVNGDGIVSSVDVTNYPRMVFSLGGVWNETET